MGCSTELQPEQPGFTRLVIHYPGHSAFHGILDPVGALRVPTLSSLLLIATNSENPLIRGRYVVPANSSAAWTVANGSYHFALLGYSGTTTQSTSPTCALALGDDGTYGNPSVLGGGSKTIRFDTSLGSCSSSPFGIGSSLTSGLTVSLCNARAQLSAAVSTESCVDLDDTGQTVLPVAKLRAGFFSQNEFDQTAVFDPVNATGVESGCVAYSRGATGLIALSDSLGSIPSGSSSTSGLELLRLKTEIVSYSSGSCDASTRLAFYTLNQGLAAVTGSATQGTAEPAITMTRNGVTTDVSDKARFVVTSGVPRLFIKDSESYAGMVDSFSSTLTTDDTSLPSDGSTNANLVVTLKDGNGTTVGGKVVTLSSSRGTLDTISPSSATTNSSGQASFTTHSSTAGTSNLYAVDTSDGLRIDAEVSITYITTKILYMVAVGSGNLGGVSGADATCNANLPSGVTTAKAMLGAGTIRRACSTAMCTGGVSENLDWVLTPSTQYTRPDGTVIGTTNAAGIFDSNLTNPISTSARVYEETWTGIKNNWTNETPNCVNWISSSDPSGGVWGNALGTIINDSTLLSVLYLGSTACNSAAGFIYCAEQ